MRILNVAYRYPPAKSGCDVYVERISEEWAKAGHEVHTICTDLLDFEGRKRAPVGRTSINGVTVDRIPFSPLRGFPIFHATAAARRLASLTNLPLLWALCQDVGGWQFLLRMLSRSADVIHTTPVPRSNVAASLFFRRLRGIPTAVTPFYHYSLEEFTKYDKQWGAILGEFDAVFVSTGAEARHLRRIGVSPERIHLVGVGADFDEIRRSNAGTWRERLGIPDHAFCALTVTSNLVSDQKGIPQVVRASLAMPDVHFIFAGGTETQWKWLTQRLGAASAENCHYAGFVEGEAKYQLYRACDLFVQPSIADAAGIVYFEAMSAGMPLVMAQIESMMEIGRGVGFFVPHGNVQALISSIRRLQGDETTYAEFSRNAVAKASKHSWTLVASKLDYVLRNIARN